jgi:hypothetical protein
MVQSSFMVLTIFLLGGAVVWGANVHQNRMDYSFACGYQEALRDVRLPPPGWDLDDAYCAAYRRSAIGRGYDIPLRAVR